jgi:hypothetical protein
MFLGAFAESRKVPITFVMSVRPSVHMYRRGSHWTNFHETLYRESLRKSVQTLQIWLKSDTNIVYLHDDLRTLYCCRRHKFAIKALLWDTQYFYIVDSDMHFNTHRTHCCVSNAKGMRTRHTLRYRYTAYVANQIIYCTTITQATATGSFMPMATCDPENVRIAETCPDKNWEEKISSTFPRYGQSSLFRLHTGLVNSYFPTASSVSAHFWYMDLLYIWNHLFLRNSSSYNTECTKM